MHRQYRDRPCPVECRKMSISGTQAVGRTFRFWHVPGSKPRSQYIFLIHNHQLSILFSLHKCAYCTIFSNYLPQKHTTKSIPFFPLPISISIIHCTQSLSLPSSTYTHKSLTFPSKIPKNGLKSLFFNR